MLELSVSKQIKCFLSQTLDNLFFNRKLWKCIYQVSSYSNTPLADSKIESEIKMIQKKTECCEWVSSSNYLRHSRLGCDIKKNFLRLVRKNSNQKYEVVSLIKFSKIYQDNSLIKIDRIYSPNT